MLKVFFIGPRANPLNKIPSIGKADWLKMFNSQSECLKLA